ncbi:MAG: SDR family NAD(P)-dependent oxidoreductase, partial [Dehalococcoidia bacterium]|nr:SDR family NAD(P)-dependent oxidoreductase [Dehalococcoidia bacterium]
MPTLLVTGGAGFIGSHIVEAAARAGHTVRVFDNLSTGSLANLATIADRVTFIPGDILDPDALAEAMAGVDWVSHQAALVSTPESLAQPDRYARVNVEGTVAVFAAAQRAGVRRIVFASSAAVYGDNPNLPLAETEPMAPRSPYAASKAANELFAQATAATGLTVVALRYFNVYGPRQHPRSDYAGVIARFVERLSRGQAPTIFGDGLQTRDFVYVDDVAAANLAALTAPLTGFHALNIATGRAVTLIELVAALNAAMGTAQAPIHAPARPG